MIRKLAARAIHGALLCVSLSAAAGPTNPLGIAWKSTDNVELFGKPTGMLVAGLALALRYLAGGRYELAEAAPVGAGTVLGAGLGISVGSGVVGLALTGEVLQSVKVNLWLPAVGDFYLVTSLFFDIGVYLVVVGLVLDILRSLGAEVDRHVEAAGEAGRGLVVQRESPS